MNIVKELRKKKGIQQKELALEIGVSIPTISQWEHGKTDPSGDRLKNLSEYFGVDELTILGKGSASDNTFYSANTSDMTEADVIVQRILDRLSEMPTSPQIRLVSGIMGKMSTAQQNQVVAVVRAMFTNHPEVLEESEDNQ